MISFFENTEIVLSTAYMAPIEYYMALANAPTLVLEQHERYVKQTYRNRCKILTANGVMDLSIPVEKTSKEKSFVRDMQISEHNDWQKLHWKSIESAYNSTPFFEYYKDDLVRFYEQKWKYLWDFNQEIQATICELIDIEPTIRHTDNFEKSYEAPKTDLRDAIHPKKTTLFENAKPYYQVFEQKFGFIANLSIIDLLFNMGNESLLYITADQQNNKQGE